MNKKSYFIKIDVQQGLLNGTNIQFVTEDNQCNEIKFQLFYTSQANNVSFQRPYDLTGCKVRIVSVSNHSSQQDCDIISREDGLCSVTLMQDMYFCAGEYLSQIQIYDEKNEIIRLSTPRFKYYVSSSLQDSKTVEATDTFSIVQQMYENVVGSNALANEALQKADTSINIVNERVPVIDKAVQDANLALDRATDVATQTDLSSLVVIANDVPSDAKIGHIYLIRNPR